MTPVRDGEASGQILGDGHRAARSALETDWLALTRQTLPALTPDRGWPVSADHCFQRILLDNACGGCWYDHIVGRPAYAHASDDFLRTAIALGQAVIAGSDDLDTLNARSLAWRGKPHRRSPRKTLPSVDR